jgi:hypothetical protein
MESAKTQQAHQAPEPSAETSDLKRKRQVSNTVGNIVACRHCCKSFNPNPQAREGCELKSAYYNLYQHCCSKVEDEGQDTCKTTSRLVHTQLQNEIVPTMYASKALLADWHTAEATRVKKKTKLSKKQLKKQGLTSQPKENSSCRKARYVNAVQREAEQRHKARKDVQDQGRLDSKQRETFQQEGFMECSSRISELKRSQVMEKVSSQVGSTSSMVDKAQLYDDFKLFIMLAVKQQARAQHPDRKVLNLWIVVLFTDEVDDFTSLKLAQAGIQHLEDEGGAWAAALWCKRNCGQQKSCKDCCALWHIFKKSFKGKLNCRSVVGAMDLLSHASMEAIKLATTREKQEKVAGAALDAALLAVHMQEQTGELVAGKSNCLVAMEAQVVAKRAALDKAEANWTSSDKEAAQKAAYDLENGPVANPEVVAEMGPEWIALVDGCGDVSFAKLLSLMRRGNRCENAATTITFAFDSKCSQFEMGIYNPTNEYWVRLLELRSYGDQCQLGRGEDVHDVKKQEISLQKEHKRLQVCAVKRWKTQVASHIQKAMGFGNQVTLDLCRAFGLHPQDNTQITAARECLRMLYDFLCKEHCFLNKGIKEKQGCRCVKIQRCDVMLGQSSIKAWCSNEQGSVVYADLTSVCHRASQCHLWAHPAQLVQLGNGYQATQTHGEDQALLVVARTRDLAFESALGLCATVKELITRIANSQLFMTYYKFQPGSDVWNFKLETPVDPTTSKEDAASEGAGEEALAAAKKEAAKGAGKAGLEEAVHTDAESREIEEQAAAEEPTKEETTKKQAAPEEATGENAEDILLRCFKNTGTRCQSRLIASLAHIRKAITGKSVHVCQARKMQVTAFVVSEKAANNLLTVELLQLIGQLVKGKSNYLVAGGEPKKTGMEEYAFPKVTITSSSTVLAYIALLVDNAPNLEAFAWTKTDVLTFTNLDKKGLFLVLKELIRLPNLRVCNLGEMAPYMGNWMDVLPFILRSNFEFFYVCQDAKIFEALSISKKQILDHLAANRLVTSRDEKMFSKDYATHWRLPELGRHYHWNTSFQAFGPPTMYAFLRDNVIDGDSELPAAIAAWKAARHVPIDDLLFLQ